MDSRIIIGLAVVMLVSQALLVRAVLLPSSKNTACEAATLTPEVKAYIDGHSTAGASGEEMARLFKKIADLEQQAGRLEYLRNTLSTMEEAQTKLGKAAQDVNLTINDLIGPARERELQRFRINVEDICSPNGVAAHDGSSGLKTARPPFVSRPTAPARQGR